MQKSEMQDAQMHDRHGARREYTGVLVVCIG
jgi:hypothetical protein